MENNLLAGLNPVQKEAVITTEGPLLVLAGAGTGKTKVLTSRIAYILQEHKAKTSEILAVTFTNKAAKEMKTRIENLLNYPIDGFWIGTFHSIGLRFLKRYPEKVDLSPNFIILDTYDSEKIIKQILQDNNVDTKTIPASYVYSLISKLKDKAIMPFQVSVADDAPISKTLNLSAVYTKYQTRLRELNSVDFGDLILLCLTLFEKHPEILDLWQTKFKYVLVDEYQDTNTIQYALIKILSSKYKNICCVGDDDQSIYSWRGADITNILKFEEDFLGAKVLRLEQNYRSTTAILNVASSLISNNKQRLGKTLWTTQDDETKVSLFRADSSRQEVDFIANTIENAVLEGSAYEDFAILVRSSFQTREIEQGLSNKKIPYRMLGGTRFWDRMEIKDAIAYLRLRYMKGDDLSFERIINVPKRGIGNTSLDKIKSFATTNGYSYFEAAKHIVGLKIVTSKIEAELRSFTSLFYEPILIDGITLGEEANKFLESVGYIDMWKAEGSEESKERLANIRELCSFIDSFYDIGDFFDQVALFSDKDEENEGNKVSISTIHGAKGLEFNVVFLPGWEEGLFPNQRALDEGGDKSLQEERRLAYVAITRAKKSLHISYCLNRYIYKTWKDSILSRFISEIDESDIKQIHPFNGYSPNNNFGIEPNKTNKAYHNPITSQKWRDNSKYDNYDDKKHSHYDKIDETPVSPKSYITKGATVIHPTYGEGIVQELNGPVASVDFPERGNHKIMVSFLKIK